MSTEIPCAEKAEAVTLPTAVCFSPDDNREITPESVADLVSSIGDQGQLVPGIAFPHPTVSPGWVVADGNRRLLACRIRGIGFKAVLLEKAPTQAELIRLRLTTNAIRRDMDAGEIGADLFSYMQATGCAQDELVEVFKFTAGYVSKLLAPFLRGTPALLAALRERRIALTAAPMIASLPPEVQEVVIPLCLGKKRRQVEQIVAEHRQKKAKPREPEPLTLEAAGFCFRFNPTAQPEAILAFLGQAMDAVRKAEKHSLPVDSIPSLFRK